MIVLWLLVVVEALMCFWPTQTIRFVKRFVKDVRRGLAVAWGWLRRAWWLISFAEADDWTPIEVTPGPWKAMVVEYETAKHESLGIVPAQPKPVEPEPTDPFWLAVVGIPFEVWVNAAIKCHGPNGFEIGGARMAWLIKRRADGDFREPVDLVKRYKRIPDEPVVEITQVIAENDLQIIADAAAAGVVAWPRAKSWKDMYQIVREMVRRNVPQSIIETYVREQRRRLHALSCVEFERKQAEDAYVWGTRRECAGCHVVMEKRLMSDVPVYDPDTAELLGTMGMCRPCAARSRRWSKAAEPCDVHVVNDETGECIRCLEPHDDEIELFADDALIGRVRR